MRQIIDSILDSAFSAVSRRAGAADLACGIIAALGRLRAMVEASMGPSGAAAFDDAVRDLLLRQGVREAAWEGRPAQHVSLPIPGPQTVFASTVLEDAALTCIALQAIAPAGILITETTAALVEALVAALDGIPEPAALLARLRPRDGTGAAAVSTLPNLRLQ